MCLKNTQKMEDTLPVTDEWLEKKEEEVIQIFVKTLTGKTVMFEARQNSTVLDVKRWIETTQEVPIEHQRFIFAGRVLEENDKTLKFYNIQKESTLHLVCRLSGC